VAHPRVDAIVEQARAAVAAAQSSSELEAIRVGVLGRQGSLTQLLRSLGTLPAEERPLVGSAANEAKRELEGLLDARLAATAAAERQAERSRRRLDLTLPGRRPPKGSLHPLTRVHDEIVAIFAGLGFSVAEGPEIESDYHNFEALNIPRDHPARDMQDTFYVHGDYLQHDPGGIVLRTHTSPGQIRTMLDRKPPIRVVVPGKVYRADSDATHTPMFHQIEGLLVDRKVTMAELKGTLDAFVRAYFGPDRRTRFRPSFFPFTEPSGELDVSCGACAGKGCRLCKQSGWLEILGCGMVHQNVFKAVGYPEGSVTGFAFGMGIERVAMLRYGLDDLRSLFENDVRLLEQF